MDHTPTFSLDSLTDSWVSIINLVKIGFAEKFMHRDLKQET
jgi:hypothetical protein